MLTTQPSFAEGVLMSRTRRGIYKQRTCRCSHTDTKTFFMQAGALKCKVYLDHNAYFPVRL
jgi:hypothetical protein